MFQIAVFGAGSQKLPSEVMELNPRINFYDYDAEKMLEPIEPEPQLILCYPSENMPALEIAQTLRMNYPEHAVYFLATEKKDFDKRKLIKNGFSDAFLLPWEKADFLKAMKEESLYSIQPELRDYKPIKVIDLHQGSVLDFGLRIFLPRNNKLLPFAAAGDLITVDKLNKLNENSLNTLYVHKDDVQKFYQYSANTLKKMMVPKGMSETEKQEKLEKTVRELISDMFIEDNRENTFGKSQSLLKEVKEIINILLTDQNADLMKKINLIINQEENFYLHLTNVSTYAGLFAMVLGMEKPEELALAGILHDIGKINLPPEIASLEMSQLSGEALTAYKNHPKYSLDVAKLKRLVLPERVMKAILHHHEAMNGSGYPAGLTAPRISQEGRLLAIANAFDHMTSLKPHQKNLTLREALLKLYEMNSSDPGRMILDVDMLRKLKDTFIK